ncbi:hypothetical protein ILUMI_21717 [Ignelater luminosus]|uniref:C2H2-type domain-containing protein n=1 Tax=Ignelater luminosus TaxID=2038154 RepID=A0A8K0CF47_IGNLU|nr:hypothetical protein ILUMI_21717 [Ignelater luminosus]
MPAVYLYALHHREETCCENLGLPTTGEDFPVTTELSENNLNTIWATDPITFDNLREQINRGRGKHASSTNRAREWGHFGCSQCGRSYTRKDSLQRHLTYECGIEPQFQCPFCPQKSKRKSHRLGHIKSQHRDKIGFENRIISTLMQINKNINQHSLILSQLLTQSKSNANDLIPPNNVPKFPIKSLKEFQQFEDLLENDPSVCQYLIKRLAAIGGSGIASLTRRIMKYLLKDDVCVLYSWKGRDKIPFEKTKTMDIIYQAAKTGFPSGGENDLLIANPVKDWLKFARSRMNRQKV